VDATAWVAVAGIAGTLLGALLAPVLTERMRRKGVRQEQLMGQCLDVYADLLRATARLADNAMTWSAIPLADLKETDDDELDRLMGRVRVVASEQVHDRFKALTKQLHEFNRLLLEARPHHQRVRDAGEVDDTTSIKQRTTLGGVADKIVESHKQLEKAIRDEMQH